MKKSVAAISLSAALLGGGAVGVALGLPGTSGAATTDTTAVTAAPSDAASTPTTAAAAATPAPAADATDPAADATDPAAGAATSNEDLTHEAGEGAAREADEAAGKVGGHHGDHLGGGSNEDSTHEANESAAREAEEDAAAAAQATAPATPSTTAAPSNA